MLIAAIYCLCALVYGACVGVVGFAFCEVVANLPGPQKHYFNAISTLPDILHKPLGGCVVCFSGQLALWTSAVLVWGFDPMFPSIASICVAAGSSISTSYTLARLNA